MSTVAISEQTAPNSSGFAQFSTPLPAGRLTLATARALGSVGPFLTVQLERNDQVFTLRDGYLTHTDQAVSYEGSMPIHQGTSLRVLGWGLDTDDVLRVDALLEDGA